MSFWALIRSGGGTDAEIRALQASQERLESESSIEDTDELTMARVDYDQMTFSMDPAEQKMTFGDRSDSDNVTLDDDALDGQHIQPMAFRMAGGDGTSYVPMSPLPTAKTGDTVTGDGGYAGPDQAVMGFSQLGIAS